MAGVRWADVDDPGEYMARALAGELPEAFRELRAQADLVLEEIMSGIRWLDGFDLAAFAARTGIDPRVVFRGVLDGLARDGYATVDGGGVLRLHEQGFLFLNTVTLRFYQHAEAMGLTAVASVEDSRDDGRLVTLGRAPSAR